MDKKEDLKKSLKQNKIIDYIGSKEKLFPWIFEKITKDTNLADKDFKFMDLFSGTTVFSKMLFENVSWKMSLNDGQLFSSKIAFYIDGYIEKERLLTLLSILDNAPIIENGIIFNEFGFGGDPKSISDKNKVFQLAHEKKCRGFFSTNVSKKLDTVKEKIKELLKKGEITEKEKDILMLFVISYADRNANTTSVYGAYLKELKVSKEIPFFNTKMVEQLITEKDREISKYNNDVLECLDLIPEQNIIYMDPPYNTRDYYTLYHILNYIIDLDFKLEDIKPNTKSAIPSLKKENIFSSSKTFNSMYLIIDKAMAKSNKVFISYNNESFLTKEQFIEIFNKLNLDYVFHTKEHQKYISRTDRDYENTKVEEWLIEVSHKF